MAKDSNCFLTLALELLNLEKPNKMLLNKLIHRIDIYENRKIVINYKFNLQPNMFQDMMSPTLHKVLENTLELPSVSSFQS